MGCAPSKLDGLLAVALCRDRNKYLDQALSQAQALADAHVAYSDCLKTLGPSLTCFFSIGLLEPEPSTSRTTSALGSGSGHIQFFSDSESEDGAEKSSDESSRGHSYDGLSSSGVVVTSHFAKTPPPPPSPISSTWDFLNLFDDMYEIYESVYAFNSEAITDHDETIGRSKVGDGGGVKDDDAKTVEEEEQKSEAAVNSSAPSQSVEVKTASLRR